MRQVRAYGLWATCVAALVVGCSPATGGSSSPQLTPTTAPTSTAKPSASPTAAPTATAKPTAPPTVGPTLTPSAAPSVSPTPTATATIPAACSGQVDFPTYATLQTGIPSGGGGICVPKFGGFGNTLQLPSLSSGPPELSITESSSTTNYAGYPLLGPSGTPIFYLGLVLGQPFQFSDRYRDTGGLASKKIVANSFYTMYGQISTFGVPIALQPCSTPASPLPNHVGILPLVGSIFRGSGAAAPSNDVVEVYAGKLTQNPCAAAPSPTPAPSATPTP